MGKLYILLCFPPRNRPRIKKYTVQALKHPSADAVTQSGHKSDTTASKMLCQ